MFFAFRSFLQHVIQHARLTFGPLLFALCLLPALLSAQNHIESWDRPFQPHGAAAIQSTIQATNGYIVSVGATSAQTKGGTDGLLRIIDPGSGQVRTEKKFGGSQNDILYGVAQRYDGLFLLAGATESKGKGQKDGWLLVVNEFGELVQEMTFGTAGSDEFRYITAQSDGSALLAGSKNGSKEGDVWLAKYENGALTWETQAGSGEFADIKGFARSADGGMAWCGNTGKKAENGIGYAYLAKADVQGKLLWKKYYGDKGWNEIAAMAATADGGYALAGATRSKGAGETDAWLVKVSREGFRQWDKTYGGKGADMAQGILQNEEGFLLAGATKSHRLGARTHAAWIVQTSSGGELQWEQFYGGEKEDAFPLLFPLYDGAYIAASNSGNALSVKRFNPPVTGRNAWAGVRDAGSVQTSQVTLRSADGALRAGEQSALSFLITNTTDLDIPDLRVTVEKGTANAAVDAWETNYFGALRKGESITADIPVRADATLTDGACEFTLTVAAGDKKLQTLSKSITMRNPRPAMLGINSHQFDESRSSDVVTLRVEIGNSGDAGSGPVEVRFSHPAGIAASGASNAMLGSVSAHSSRNVQFNFTKTAGFSGTSAGIVCIVMVNGREEVRKTLEWYAGGKTVVSGGPVMIWTDPAPHETGTNKVRTSNNEFEYKMIIQNSAPVSSKNISIKVNGVEMEGSKFNEQELSAPKREASRYIYSYRNKVPLVQGVNRLEVMVDGHTSDFIEVTFAPERANLHLLAIGPRHEDLKYTGKDAADIIAAFQSQGGADQLFNQVFTYDLTTPENTSDTRIKQAFYDLAYLWKDKQIGPNDVLLVFISSHGKISENRFKILQTGYNPRYEYLAIDFKNDILEVISPINCKKLIFIDACHSGGAKDGYGAVSKALVDLARTAPGVSTLSSSSSTEKSYEDASWGNGAFTKAMLEAFANKQCNDINGAYRADTDNDGVIRLGELYSFLRRRVPDLVKTALPNAPTSQTPFMPENQLDADMPIYLLRR
ncbi:MAG: caspase family protein [Saprospiraceae bacterium]|nr:caspase family protein [Saprospiraceae bacterium]